VCQRVKDLSKVVRKSCILPSNLVVVSQVIFFINYKNDVINLWFQFYCM
jgi:hypothetical protein